MEPQGRIFGRRKIVSGHFVLPCVDTFDTFDPLPLRKKTKKTNKQQTKQTSVYGHFGHKILFQGCMIFYSFPNQNQFD